MRRIVIPHEAMLKATAPITGCAYEGTHVLLPVRVDWPELRLTEEQILANAAALAFGKEQPYPNNQIFFVQIPRVPFGIRP